MAAALPAARGLFSQMQLALRTDSKHRINLSKGVHAALDDFRYLHKDISNRPTRLQEIVPLDPVLTKYHDASGFACGGVVIPNNTAVSRNKKCNPILWRASFPKAIQKRLVSFKNPKGDVTNSDLELVAGIADFCSLTFSTQKNGVKNEKIGHVRSGHHLCCPVAAIIQRVKHLWANNASPDTPLSMYFGTTSNRWFKVTSKDITANLRQAVIVLNPTALGFDWKTLKPEASNLVALWHCFAAMLIPTRSVSWAVGSPMLCYDTFTSKPSPYPTVSPNV